MVITRHSQRVDMIAMLNTVPHTNDLSSQEKTASAECSSLALSHSNTPLPKRALCALFCTDV